MATIEKRTSQDGAAGYRVKVRLTGFPGQTATFERLTDARKWAQNTESAIREGRHFKTTEAKRHTLRDAIDRYLQEVMPTKRANTIKAQERQLRWWREQLGDYTLADITPPLLAQYRECLAAGATHRGAKRSPATVIRYLAALSHVLTVAMKEWQWIDDSPMRKVTKPKEPRGRVRFLADDEREALLAACKASHNRDLYLAVVLALSTGARQMEILTLTWKQVDLARQLIVVEDTKNGERRGLPLVGHALELMHEHAKARRLGTDLLFPARKRNSIRPIDLRDPFDKALKQAGITDFSWHDLRHSCASYLAMNGASLAEIAEVLGHKSLNMVQRYAHLSRQHVAGVVARMNAKVFGGAT